MENKRIVIDNGDGTVNILIPSPKSGLTLDQIIKKDIPEDKSYRVVDVSALPSDRIFRGAWTYNSSIETVDINLSRAKGIAHNFRRHQRDTLMRPLDIKATIPAEAEQAETERQKIREINTKLQTNINLANSPEGLITILTSMEV